MNKSLVFFLIFVVLATLAAGIWMYHRGDYGFACMNCFLFGLNLSNLVHEILNKETP